MPGLRDVTCWSALAVSPAAFSADAGASQASRIEEKADSSNRMRTVPMDGMREKATEYLVSSMESTIQRTGNVGGREQHSNTTSMRDAAEVKMVAAP